MIDLSELDPGIRSGDGATKLANEWLPDDALDYPHVFMHVSSLACMTGTCYGAHG